MKKDRPENYQDSILRQEERMKNAKAALSKLDAVQQTLDNMETEVKSMDPKQALSPQILERYMGALSSLHMPGCNTQNPERPEYLDFQSSPKSGGWHSRYVELLLDYAKHIYVQNPTGLPAPLLSELYQHMAFHQRSEFGAMGHHPAGYVHHYNPETEITLLQLPTSGLMKWMWGDMYQLVLTMTKADLAGHDFSRVKLQITN